MQTVKLRAGQRRRDFRKADPTGSFGPPHQNLTVDAESALHRFKD